MKKLLTLACLLISFTVFAGYMNNPNVKLIFNTIDHCYIVEHKTDVELAECVSKTLMQLPNREFYRVKIYKDKLGRSASDIKILIYNKKGFILFCKGLAKEKIVINSCRQYKGKGLSGEELRYIDVH